MKKSLFTGMMLLSLLTAALADADTQDRAEHMLTAPYLLPGAPTFDMNIGKFREKYNACNPTLQIPEYRVIDNRDDKSNLNRAASKINENIYSSTALEPGTGKIKTLQITWLPIPGPEEKSSRDTARAYMAALERFFEPTLNEEQSLKRLDDLLNRGKGLRYFAQSEGAVRYVIADNGDKGLTFAIEPVKLAMVNE
ncbi:DUF1454 family protein [Erwinia psidii]|uniref:DUF1454 family protein n=1 Tax=Erwinia psidii TaxID=69224 RepID=A0A3N6SEV3_9GAMM|nr:DUF1454 family protein [Erwinia psidii]MCX8959185.1 DUF1454 family protein [Erwinia psidii]MCX8962197.1 DUF1454 family protein [Erwinia psidii]MCX8966729.1 DUF1454 family protein [Erwinia psidii]RQM37181.1 DUF1454 family protein [Erwinia psidii]